MSKHEYFAARVLQFLPEDDEPRNSDHVIVEFLEWLYNNTTEQDKTALAFMQKVDEYFGPDIFEETVSD